MDEHSLRLVDSYLMGMLIECMVGMATLGRIFLGSGVREGSILGPLYFVAALMDIIVTAKRAMENREHGI